jgi:predicted transcriptional regulator
MAQLARELRNALPAVVREAVEQVFAREQGRDGEDGKL